MKKIIILITIFSLILSFSVFPLAIAAPNSTDSVSAKLLAKARQATAKYHDVNVALADGYVPSGPCVAAPPGTMGIHYINFGLIGDSTIDELTPEILLYVDTNSGPRLVAVEYYALAIGTNGTYIGPWFDHDLPAGWTWLSSPSTIFGGTSMHGPIEPHDEGQPWHYDLHVWLWQGNPEGIFEEFNPKVNC
jgi:hypothetical protein